VTISVQTHRFSALLQRLFIAKGGAGGAGLTVLDDVMPVIDLAGDNDSEMRRARSEDMCGHQAGIAAVAGQVPFVRFENDTTDRLFVLQSFVVWGVTAQQWSINVGAAIAGVNFNAIAMDLRAFKSTGSIPAIPGTRCFVGTTAAPGGTAVRQLWQLANVNTELVPPMADYIIPPGQTLVLAGGIVNTTVVFNFTGYSRQVEANELA
jgi:hypothetical protein